MTRLGIALWLLLSAMAVSMCARAETALDAIAAGMTRGTLPEWMPYSVEYRLLSDAGTSWLCLATADERRWVLRMQQQRIGQWLYDQRPQEYTAGPITDDDWSRCWPGIPSPLGPRTVTGYAYPEIRRADGVIDWAHMRPVAIGAPGQRCRHRIEGDWHVYAPTGRGDLLALCR